MSKKETQKAKPGDVLVIYKHFSDPIDVLLLIKPPRYAGVMSLNVFNLKTLKKEWVPHILVVGNKGPITLLTPKGIFSYMPTRIGSYLGDAAISALSTAPNS
jgi:hypothetical protein